MTALAPAPRAATPVRRHVVAALARQELRRTVRSLWLLVGIALTVLVFEDWRGPQQWHGERYGYWFTIPSALLVAISLVVALSFHRERTTVAPAAPVGDADRCLARLLAALPLLLLPLAAVTGVAAYVWSIGGLDLGHEPGRTLHAYPTVGELCQPVAAAILAIAVGAAAGRHLRHRATAMLVLVAGWLPVTFTYWAFGADAVAPFSVLQSQPVSVPVGPRSSDPLSFPAHWLLEPPGQYQEGWTRLVVSEPLAWWHNGWLLGLSLLVLAVAVPRPARRPLALAGGVLATVCVAAQFWVYP